MLPRLAKLERHLLAQAAVADCWSAARESAEKRAAGALVKSGKAAATAGEIGGTVEDLCRSRLRNGFCTSLQCLQIDGYWLQVCMTWWGGCLSQPHFLSNAPKLIGARDWQGFGNVWQRVGKDLALVRAQLSVSFLVDGTHCILSISQLPPSLMRFYILLFSQPLRAEAAVAQQAAQPPLQPGQCL